MTEQEAMEEAWKEHYGNISNEYLPPMHNFFREAFTAGIKYERTKTTSVLEDNDNSSMRLNVMEII